MVLRLGLHFTCCKYTDLKLGVLPIKGNIAMCIMVFYIKMFLRLYRILFWIRLTSHYIFTLGAKDKCGNKYKDYIFSGKILIVQMLHCSVFRYLLCSGLNSRKINKFCKKHSLNCFNLLSNYKFKKYKNVKSIKGEKIPQRSNSVHRKHLNIRHNLNPPLLPTLPESKSWC